MRCYLPGLLSCFCLVLVSAPCAQALSFEKLPALRTFANELADEHGFSADKLRRVFRCARIRPEIIEAMERPKELLPWFEYSKIFLTEENLQRGTRFWKKHAAALTRAREQYGVAPEIVVAIIGVETQFGRNQGGYSILDSLATLMLDYPPRSAFFRQELTR